jgi:hypothetical protein
MSAIILIPAAVCLGALFLWPPARVFRDIVLPILLLLPLFYQWKVKMLPPVDFADAALLPLGLGLALRSMSRWHLSSIDLAVLLFALSTCAADRLHGQSTASTFELFAAVSLVLVPYMAGKLLIEQDNARAATLKRLVLLIFTAGLLGGYEAPARNNLFRMAFGRFFFPDNVVAWGTQLRGGLGRITGPYADAELAGMMFLIGALLAAFLGKHYKWDGRLRVAPGWPVRKSALIALSIVFALFLTQSRGPELGLLFAAPIAWIGRSRHVLRTALLVTLLMTVGGFIAYQSLARYAATRTPTSDEQETAQYRAVLLQQYLPMAEHSGAWGLGPHFPVIGKYKSVDNEYLFVALTSGYIGLGSLLAVIAGTLYNLVFACIYNPEKMDRAFAFTLLGIFVGLLVTIATVYLDFQPLIFFFLLAGWAQALRVRHTKQPQPAFQQVYT